MDMSALLALVPAKYLIYVAAASGIFSAVATILPPPAADDKTVYPTVYKVVNFVALNLGHATNKGA